MSKRQALIVVVDDNARMREAIRSFLDSAGFKTETYASAEAFLSSGQVRHADCLVLDMHLPELSGLRLHAKLRAESFQIPTVLMTADPDECGHLRAEASAAGIPAVLFKPFQPDILVDLVRVSLIPTL